MAKPTKRHRPADVFLSGVPQVQLDAFFASLLHWIPEGDFSRVKTQLLQSDHVVHDAWASYNVKYPAWNDAMKGLQSIFAAVVQVAKDTPGTQLVVSSYDSSIVEYYPHAEFRLVSAVGEAEQPWLSTAIPWRIDKDGDPKSNHDNLIWNCHDVLREDARRRFTFGITLDADELRLWFFSRTHNIVSEPLKFISDPDALVRLFLAIALASPEQLGYDTTMSYFLDDSGTVQFKLSLNDAVHVTKRLLSDNRSDVICGRATRVWEAYREDDPDRTPVVIKDLWTSLDSAEEGAQLLDLHAQLKALEAPGTPRPPSDYFLTVVAHGFVQTADGVDDHTVDVMLRGHAFKVASANHNARKHYRIVFSELGVPLQQLQGLSDVFQALADATRALSLLHRLGFVHRDVSAGNILLFNGKGKLTDLEYLVSIETSVRNPGIGTPEYTSIEVAWDSYAWTPSPGTVPVIEKNPVFSDFVVPPFRFNPLHDLESTLWIAFWAILYHHREAEVHACALEKYFHEQSWDRGIDTGSRMLALKHGFPRGPPDDPSTFATDILNILRGQLLGHFIAFERDMNCRFRLLHTPAIVTPVEGAQDFIAQYEKVGILSKVLLTPTTEKRKAEEDNDIPVIIAPVEAAQDFITQYGEVGILSNDVVTHTAKKRKADEDRVHSATSVPPCVSGKGSQKNQERLARSCVCSQSESAL